jgi:hypothetical protein
MNENGMASRRTPQAAIGRSACLPASRYNLHAMPFDRHDRIFQQAPLWNRRALSPMTTSCSW